MKNKLIALAGDLREQAATALETLHSIALESDFSEVENIETYANLLAQSLIDTADELEQIASEGHFKENVTGLHWVQPDDQSYLYIRYGRDQKGHIQTEIYGWIRQEGFLWLADIQRSPGHFENIANLPIDGADVFMLQSMIADVAHEVTPIILEGEKYRAY